MDAVKKNRLEQVVVLGLLVIFVVSLQSTLKRLFGGGAKTGAPAHASPLAAADVPPDAVGKTMRQMQGQVGALREIDRETASPPAPAARAPEPSTAFRDPMISLLPSELPEPAPATGRAAPRAPSKPAQLPSLTVQGIVLGPRSQALINGELRHVGETIQGAKIVAIRRDGVLVEIGKRQSLMTPSVPAAAPSKDRR